MIVNSDAAVQLAVASSEDLHLFREREQLLFGVQRRTPSRAERRDCLRLPQKWEAVQRPTEMASDMEATKRIWGRTGDEFRSDSSGCGMTTSGTGKGTAHLLGQQDIRADPIYRAIPAVCRSRPALDCSVRRVPPRTSTASEAEPQSENRPDVAAWRAGRL